MVKIILDTNFLLIPGQFNVDIFSEIARIMQEKYELCVIDATLDELKKLVSEGKGKDREAAELGLQLLRAKKVKALKTEKNLNADKLIQKLVYKGDFIVATQDMELKRKLKAQKTKIIVLRKKSYLELV